MKPVLIFFKEVPFKENKFVLDFSDEQQHVQPIDFERNAAYYIATLDCKLKLKKVIQNKQDKDDISKLSVKNKILEDKGSDHFCDIDVINLVYASGIIIHKVNLRNNFHFQRPQKKLESYNYKYKFWDQKEGKIKDGEIFSPYLQLTQKGLFFKNKTTNIEFMVKIDKEKEEIHSFFYSANVRDLTYQIGQEYYSNINLFFVYDQNAPRRKQRWYTSSPNFFREAICAKVLDPRFNEKNFAKKYYNDDGKGDKVIGTFAQWLRLGGNKHLMPITYVFGAL